MAVPLPRERAHLNTLRSAIAIALLLAFVLAAAPFAAAQEADAPAAPPPSASSDGPDHDALRAIRALYEKAVAEDNLDLLKPHLHPDFTGVMVTASPVAGFDDLAAYWARIKELMGEGGKYTVTVRPAALSTIIGDLAIAYGTTDDRVVNAAGGEYRFTGHWSAVLRKVDGSWKLLRVHGSMDPVDNPFNAAAGRRIAFLFGVIGAIVGSLIGWSVTAYRRRHRPA